MFAAPMRTACAERNFTMAILWPESEPFPTSGDEARLLGWQVERGALPEIFPSPEFGFARKTIDGREFILRVLFTDPMEEQIQ
jgi:hypothetical protein